MNIVEVELELVKIESLRHMVAEILEVEVEEVQDETDLVEELDADSMMALEILASVEKEFQIKIPEEELQNFTSIKNIIKVIQERSKEG